VCACHPCRLGGVPLAVGGVADGPDVRRGCVDRGGGVAGVRERGERALLPEIALAVRRRVREDHDVLLVVGVGALDEPHPNVVGRWAGLRLVHVHV